MGHSRLDLTPRLQRSKTELAGSTPCGSPAYHAPIEMTGFTSSRSINKGSIDVVGQLSRTPRSAYGRTNRDSCSKSLTLPPLQRSLTETGGFRTMYRRPKSPTPNFTMINKREPRSATPVQFRALNQVSKPIPNLFSTPLEENKFPKKDIQIWHREVIKSVPSRPDIAIASDWKAPPAEWDDRDQYIYGPKSIFYKNTKYVVGKDFVVNPEWLSEFMTVSTYSQAYRTCALRYGWCA